MSPVQKTIPTSDVRPNVVALRGVNREGSAFQGIVDSIRLQGVLNPISVRARKDEATGADYYEIVDGLHRFTAATEAGLTEIPTLVVDFNDDQILEAQLMANIHRVDTRPVEYSNQLKRILSRNTYMTEAELATKLGVSAGYIKERLGLTKITNKEVQEAIDGGKIPLTCAYAMAKLPESEQVDFMARAMTQPPAEFIPAVTQRVKEIADSKRKGADAAPAEFQPVAFLKKMGDLKSVAADTSTAERLLALNGITSPVEAFQLALKWALHLDPEAVEKQKAENEARKKANEASAAARKAERDAKKATEASNAQAAASV